jgi:tetrapyrrole methylase family protein / MazG family protein
VPKKKLPHLKRTPRTEAEWFNALVNLARYLRSPEGCPWDRKQTVLSFSTYAGEEAAELVDACKKGEPEDIEEEWGDTLFTLIAAAAAAENEKTFNVLDALRKAHEKMIRRHGHIFGDHVAETPEDAMEVWQKIKAGEKAQRTKK